MHVDVVELRNFYANRLGKAAENSISMSLSSIWGNSSGEILLGLGYPVPWMDRFATDTERALCLMPAGQGAIRWPSGKSSATALSYDDEFPLRDVSVDRILMVHFLEHAENANECLAECWRVLSPGGNLVIVTPNRRGVWARFETTPFGTGRPYSRGQLSKLLKANQFTPSAWSDALHFAPSSRDFSLRVRPSMERLGRKFWPVFAGAHCVIASKQLYQGVPLTSKARRRLAVPVLVPQGSGRIQGKRQHS